jgi:signal transduction histidine kinase
MEARHQHLALHLPPGPLNLQADQFRLAQVFSNLLDNASKYTPEGGRISLSLVTDGEVIVVTVADDGIGITSGALPHVFDLLVQDERAIAMRSRGLGIGLSVVRDLVEAHGGSVSARSAGPDQGSEFIVRLPMNVRRV